VELSGFAISKGYVIAYDSNRGSYIIGENRLGKAVAELAGVQDPLIIVSHYVEIVPRDVLELVIVLRKSPVELIHILEKRGWNSKSC